MDGKRILIVDDSDFSRKTIVDYLEGSGLKIAAEASNANEAIRICSEKSIDLAIVDVVMPEISGIELTETLSKMSSKLGIIVISSLGQENIVMRAISAGAHDFLQKPFTKELLLESINKVLTSGELVE